MKRKSNNDCDVAVVGDGKRCRLDDVDDVFPTVQLVNYSFSDDEADDSSFSMDVLVNSLATSFKEKPHGRQLCHGRRSLTMSQLIPSAAVLEPRLDKTISAEGNTAEVKHCSCCFCQTFNDDRFPNAVSSEEMFYENLKNLHANLNMSAVTSPSEFNRFVCQTITYMNNRGNLLEKTKMKGAHRPGNTESTDSKTREMLCAANILGDHIRVPAARPKKGNKVVRFGTNFIRWIRNQKQNRKLRVKKT